MPTHCQQLESLSPDYILTSNSLWLSAKEVQNFRRPESSLAAAGDAQIFIGVYFGSIGTAFRAIVFLFFVYATHFLRLCSEVLALSLPPQTGRNIF